MGITRKSLLLGLAILISGLLPAEVRADLIIRKVNTVTCADGSAPIEVCTEGAFIYDDTGEWEAVTFWCFSSEMLCESAMAARATE